MNFGRIAILGIMICMTASFGMCYGSKYTSWRKNATVGGIHFSKLRYVVDRGDTTGTIGYLANDTEIDGVPCAAGWVHFFPERTLSFFCLSHDHSYCNVPLMAGTWIVGTRDSVAFTIVLPGDTIINGYHVRGGGGSKGITTTFYRTGELYCFFSKDTVTIDGVSCSGGLLHLIRLYKNGKLKSCTTAKPVVIDGVKIGKKTRLYLDPSGKMIAER